MYTLTSNFTLLLLTLLDISSEDEGKFATRNIGFIDKRWFMFML